jgi:hypothetical protein
MFEGLAVSELYYPLLGLGREKRKSEIVGRREMSLYKIEL